MAEIVIREATAADADTIHDLVRSLAEFERAPDAVRATPEDFRREGFGDVPSFRCLLAEVGGRPAGFALWFYNFSTFAGKAGIYLEDLFVEPHLRGHGIGKALLKRLARRCVDEGLPRLQWWVLDWNEPSIAVYKSLGAKPMDEWTVFRVSGPELEALAS